MSNAFIWVFLAISLFSSPIYTIKSDLNYEPNGDNSLLYRPGIDKVVNLDQETFGDTVFNSSAATLVEIYKDWCGHCRKFTPVYRAFAKSVQNWNEYVQVAALNCADLHNRKVCNSTRQIGKKTVPSMKLYPPQSANFKDAFEFDPNRTVDEMRHLLVDTLMEQENKWKGGSKSLLPVKVVVEDSHCASLKDILKEVWRKVSSAQITNVAAIFAETDGLNDAVALKLDLSPYKERLDVFLVDSNSKLAEMLEIKTFPTVALFKKGDDSPVSITALDNSSASSIVHSAGLSPVGSQIEDKEDNSTKHDIVDCDKEPEECKKLYYVSERDMLKALRMALYNEVLNEDFREGKDFDNIKEFLEILIEEMKNSLRAHQLFEDLMGFLHSKEGDRKFTATEWNSTFLDAEKKNEFPFPDKDADWEHCHGTSIEFRGFTCGLWTAFHTFTVHSYLNGKNNGIDTDDATNGTISPLKPLKAIQGWADSFFSCSHCRTHFLKMTQEEFPMDETKVKKPEDAFLYLWEAHNLVNNHLKGDQTEDPQFKKYQFPPAFLCNDCRTNEKDYDMKRVQEFLVEYYTNIKPHH
ncbi:erv1 / alr family domain-containing protein [Ditylenchus destructor]|uniref:Sulfhydryl oxidase n=1 Tax=Ditylenchus destructor TaxID=166010 RepID=A0AAD4R9A1_9BILA|nr:erv1 / alr family domain-containing protein [Ditylenchus destructor]